MNSRKILISLGCVVLATIRFTPTVAITYSVDNYDGANNPIPEKTTGDVLLPDEVNAITNVLKGIDHDDGGTRWDDGGAGLTDDELEIKYNITSDGIICDINGCVGESQWDDITSPTGIGYTGGNVGVGLQGGNKPLGRLHLHKGVSSRPPLVVSKGAYAWDPDASAYDIVAGDGNDYWGIDAGTNFGIGNSSKADLFNVTSVGKVGIGKINPSNLLDIETKSIDEGLSIDGRLSVSGFDGGNWLRLNHNEDWTSGVYTPGKFRADGGIVIDDNMIISSDGSRHTAKSSGDDHYGFFEARNNNGDRGVYLGWGDGGNRVDLYMDNANYLKISGGDLSVSDSMAIGNNTVPYPTYQFSVDALKVGVSGANDYQRAIYAGVNPDPALWSASGGHVAAGLTASVLTDSSLTTGSRLNTLIGTSIQYGAYTGTAGIVTNARGLQILPYRKAGTIDNQYDIYIANTSGTATLTNKHFAMYQMNSATPNYFAGNVGIGTTDAKAKLDVNGGIKLGDDGGACDGTKEGTIRYNGTDLELCDGTDWGNIVSEDTENTGVAAGFVSAFSGTSCPADWLEADGGEVSRTSYATLFGRIGEMYGAGDGSTTFNLPNYRGQFLRGWDRGDGTDPDTVTRTNRGDGIAGDNVGTKQNDELRSHRHSAKWNNCEKGTNCTMGGKQFMDGNGGDYVDSGYTEAIAFEGGSETRPKNINVLYCIKMIDGGDGGETSLDTTLPVCTEGESIIFNSTSSTWECTNGTLGRSIFYATANGPEDDIDTGQIVSRVLSFTKAKADTDIKFSYTDNFRTAGAGKSCRWEIRIDGVSCPSQPLVYDYYYGTNNSRSLDGYCSNLGIGNHEMQIWVSNTPGYSGSDCYTGWKLSTWVLEAEEIY